MKWPRLTCGEPSTFPIISVPMKGNALSATKDDVFCNTLHLLHVLRDNLCSNARKLLVNKQHLLFHDGLKMLCFVNCFKVIPTWCTTTSAGKVLTQLFSFLFQIAEWKSDESAVEAQHRAGSLAKQNAIFAVSSSIFLCIHKTTVIGEPGMLK